MANIEELKKQEIEELTHDNEAMDLETLILQGSETTVPIIIDYPVYVKDHVEYKQVSAFIKPITNIQANKAYQQGLQNHNTTPDIEMVKQALYTKNHEPIKPELVEKMPSGVITAIVKQIMDVSGIKINKEETEKLVRRLMDF